jgi:hypothetical protein
MVEVLTPPDVVLMPPKDRGSEAPVPVAGAEMVMEKPPVLALKPPMEAIVAPAGILTLPSETGSPTKRPVVEGRPVMVVVLLTVPFSFVLAAPKVTVSEAALPVTGAEMVT